MHELGEYVQACLTVEPFRKVLYWFGSCFQPAALLGAVAQSEDSETMISHECFEKRDPLSAISHMDLSKPVDSNERNEAIAGTGPS